jgi:hypothetical protein
MRAITLGFRPSTASGKNLTITGFRRPKMKRHGSVNATIIALNSLITMASIITRSLDFFGLSVQKRQTVSCERTPRIRSNSARKVCLTSRHGRPVRLSLTKRMVTSLGWNSRPRNAWDIYVAYAYWDRTLKMRKREGKSGILKYAELGVPCLCFCLRSQDG